MRFTPTQENRAFARSIGDLLASADTIGAARAWADGDDAPGKRILAALAELGVAGLLVPEIHDGLDAEPVDLATAFEAIGYHAVVGPVVESYAVLPKVLSGELATAHLGALAGGAIGTVAVTPRAPRMLDADSADVRFVIGPAGIVETGTPSGPPRASIDRTRRLFDVDGLGDGPSDIVATAELYGGFAVAAQLCGAGRRLLDESVAYAKARVQYGRAIGEYQAIKHLLADVATRLELATPLVHGAAVALAEGRSGGVDLDPIRDVAAARVAAADAAYLAARTALQVHGAIGYTDEYHLGIWLTKVRALQSVWGTQAQHRATVLRSVSGVSR